MDTLGVRIKRITVIDDDPSVRRSVSMTVQDALLEPIDTGGPLPALGKLAEFIKGRSDAAVCDHKLRVAKYSAYDGAQAAAALYDAKVPALVSTSWVKADIDAMRQYRRKIPVLLHTKDTSPDAIVKGLQLCIREFNNDFGQARAPWRTLVRVEDSDQHHVFVVVPGWNSGEVIRLLKSDLPGPIAATIVAGKRLHARVNLGATLQEELYFEAWEGQ